MLWSDRQGLNVLNAYGDDTGDTQDFVQQINARIALDKFVSSLFGGEGIYLGGANSIGEFLNNGKEFPPVSLIINADSSSTVTKGPTLSVTIHTPGSGYSVGDILTITGGHQNATLEVIQVSTGAVSAVAIISGGTAYSVANGYTTTVSPAGGTNCKINITAIAGEPWFFSSLQPKSINFSVTNAGGNSGVLYAQIKPIAGLYPIGAVGDPDDFILIAQNNMMTAPANAMLLGTGTISNSAFTSWTVSDYVFVDATSQSTQSWIADTHSGSITVSDTETINFYGQNGVQVDLSQTQNQLILSANVKSTGGLTTDSNGLAVKIKTDGGFGVDSSGLFIANSAVKFFISSNSGDPATIIDKDTLTISVSDPLTSTGGATDKVTLALNLSSTGGLETTVDNKLSIKLDSSGKLSKDSEGLYSQPVSFLISGDSSIEENIIQTINENDILYMYGSNSIYTDNTSGTLGRIQIGIQLDSLSGLQITANELSVLVNPSPGTGNEAIILDSNGLSLASAVLNASYGAPASGTYATSDFYRDAGGALFICTSGGTPGTWTQLTIGKTYVTSDDDDSEDYILPLDADFNGSSRQRGYRIDWVSGFDYLNQYRNTMPWIWYNESGGNKYWISQSQFPVQMGKLYLDASVEDSNPVDINASLNYGLIPSITSNTVSISTFKAFWSYINNKYNALLVEDFYVISNSNPVVSLNYTYNPFNTSYSIGTITVSSNIGTLNYDKGLKYFNNPDDTTAKRIILATFNTYSDEYSHIDLTYHSRYISDQDSVLDRTP